MAVLFCCNQTRKFDSVIWKQKGVDWWMTDSREEMVENLIQSDTLIGHEQYAIKELLGEPEAKKIQASNT